MKRDIEAWFPVTGGGEYKELVSVSNCVSATCLYTGNHI